MMFVFFSHNTAYPAFCLCSSTGTLYFLNDVRVLQPQHCLSCILFGFLCWNAILPERCSCSLTGIFSILNDVRAPHSAQGNEETDLRVTLPNPLRHLALNSLDTERVATDKIFSSVTCNVMYPDSYEYSQRLSKLDDICY
jgi:hypothetical protein